MIWIWRIWVMPEILIHWVAALSCAVSQSRPKWFFKFARIGTLLLWRHPDRPLLWHDRCRLFAYYAAWNIAKTRGT